MRAVVQRVAWARVRVGGVVRGEIGAGLCVLLCAMQGDGASDYAFMARKLSSLRIFPDAQERMNLSLVDVAGAVLLVSQFTLAADTTSGSRPSFSSAMAADEAPALLEQVAAGLRAQGLRVETGSFGAKMELELLNAGPVTIYLDSRDKR